MTPMTAVASANGPTLPNAPPRQTVFDVGSETCPQGQLPGPLEFTPEEAKNARNPLHYLPVVGFFYRQITGETIPAPLSIAASAASSAVLGGPIGIAGSVLFSFASELFRLGPDTSRAAVPEGMDVTGSETAMRPVTPGSIPPGSGRYTTLATVLPDFLGGPVGSPSELAQGEDGAPGAAAAHVQRAMFAYNVGNMMGPGSA